MRYAIGRRLHLRKIPKPKFQKPIDAVRAKKLIAQLLLSNYWLAAFTMDKAAEQHSAWCFLVSLLVT